MILLNVGYQYFEFSFFERTELLSEAVNNHLVVVIIVCFIVLHPRILFDASIGTAKSVTIFSRVGGVKI